MGPKELSNVLWGLASLAVPVDRELLAAISSRVASQLSDTTSTSSSPSSSSAFSGGQRREGGYDQRDRSGASDGASGGSAGDGGAVEGYRLPVVATLLWSYTTMNVLGRVDSLPLLRHLDTLISSDLADTDGEPNRAHACTC
jgi:hypothetical protein